MVFTCIFTLNASADTHFIIPEDNPTIPHFGTYPIFFNGSSYGGHNPIDVSWWVDSTRKINAGNSLRTKNRRSVGSGYPRLSTRTSFQATELGNITAYLTGFSYSTGYYEVSFVYVRSIYTVNDTVFDSKLVMYYSYEGGIHTRYFNTNDTSYLSDGQTWYGYTVNTPATDFYLNIYSYSTRAAGGSKPFLYMNIGAMSIGDYIPIPKSTFTLSDDCGNKLINATTTIFIGMSEQIYQGNDNPIILYEGTDYDRYDELRVVIDTHDLAVEKVVYADEAFNTFNLYHNHVDWNLNMRIYDNGTYDPLNQVAVTICSDCRIGGYQLCSMGFTNPYGVVTTYQLANQNFTIWCTKNGYNDYSHTFTAGFDAWSSTYVVDIYLDNDTTPGGDGNETLPYLPCTLAWSDTNNVVISEINDTETARLHYFAANCSTILYFERYSPSIDMWLIESTTQVSPYTGGYVSKTPLNWTQGETTLYRSRLWALHCVCDEVCTLQVWNSTSQNETIYENLTANTRFLDKIGGTYVDPQNDVRTRSYAAANNTTLLNINLEFYNESVMVDNISLSTFDWYVGGVFVPYAWNPDYDYAPDHNYTIKMVGFTGTILDIDTVYTNSSENNPSNPHNSLTIYVKDHHNNPLTHSTVFVETWGSIATGNTDFVVISGLTDGTYNYKATKAGYQSSGWDNVALDDEDKTVTYKITKETTSTISGYKLKEDEIKAFFLPLLYLLLIMIVIGGLINAAKP